MEKRILTREQVRSIDKRAVDEYEMPSIILMENAGRSAADLIRADYDKLAVKRVVVFAGPGNNGGDGFVIARHLHNAGWQVRVILAVAESQLKGDAQTNYRIIRHTAVPIETADAADEALKWTELVVDALLGTGFSGEVRSPLDELIDRINDSGKSVIAVDTPSGLDCQTGRPARSAIRASMTVTFVAIKSGLVEQTAQGYVGNVVTADIGVPKELIDKVTAGGS